MLITDFIFHKVFYYTKQRYKIIFANAQLFHKNTFFAPDSQKYLNFALCF